MKIEYHVTATNEIIKEFMTAGKTKDFCRRAFMDELEKRLFCKLRELHIVEFEEQENKNGIELTIKFNL